MKTQVITFFMVLILSMGTAGITKAATTEKENVTVLNNVSSISKIEIRGNVELYISSGSTDQVKVYNKYYSENALVQNDKGVLRISSYDKEKLIVWVTAKDLRAIAAYDDAYVKSFTNISQIEFNIDLHNNAKADLNLDVFMASISLKDNATAKLSGSVNQYQYNTYSGNRQSIDSRDLFAVSTTRIINQAKHAETASDDLAGL